MIYCDRQSGNLCRMHSINNYYQFGKLNDNSFYGYCDEYDKYYGIRGSRDYDMFNEGRNVIGFILERISDDFVYLLYRNDVEIMRPFMADITDIFHFNLHHIWLHKKINNNWYKLDSRAIKMDNPIQLTMGYMFVIPKKIRNKLEMHFINKIKQTQIYRNPDIFNRYLLGDGEVLIYNLYHLTKKYEKINKIAEKFRKNKNDKGIISLLREIDIK